MVFAHDPAHVQTAAARCLAMLALKRRTWYRRLETRAD
jgi:hypothetical protein